MKWVYAVLYLFGLLLILWMVTLNMDCYNAEIIGAQDWDGIVLDKRIDSSQHASKMVVIKKLDDEIHKIYRLDDDKSNFYEFIQIGDSIYKAKGSLRVYVKNKYGRTFFLLDFGCIK